MALVDHVEQRGQPEKFENDAEDEDKDSGLEVLLHILLQHRAQVMSGPCESRLDEKPYI